MSELAQYSCQTPVVLIIFNRPDETLKTLLAIQKVRPKKLFVVADGPRSWMPFEDEKVQKCRAILDIIDWDCEIVRIFSDVNLGCMRRIVTGLDTIFRIIESAIILEDDCVPNIDFFRFTEWGLKEYQNDLSIGMISGSNLISHKHSIGTRNGFSTLINIWGWATWRRVWIAHNPFLSILEVKNKMGDISKSMKLNWWQSIYWRELFIYTVYSSNTWDFQLQFSFFRLKLLSVYPCRNLIHNIGFGKDGTHTNIKEPVYIAKSLPVEQDNILQCVVDDTRTIDVARDSLLASEIWHFNIKTALRLKLMNFIRLNF